MTTGRNESKFVDPRSIMLDGIKVKISLRHPTLPETEEWRRTGRHGVVEGDTIKHYAKIDNFGGGWVRLESHDVCEGIAESLTIEGNPVKWLQSHNLFGSGDLLKIVPFFVTSVLWRLYLRPAYTAQEWDLIERGEYEVYKVSLNHQYKLMTAENADRTMRALRELATKGKQLKKTYGGDCPTVGFGGGPNGGRGNAYVSTRIYHKGREIQANRLPVGLPTDNYGQLITFANGLIRFEYDFTRDFIRKRGLTRGNAWTSEQIHLLVCEQFDRISLPRNVPISDQAELTLPRRLREIYRLWRAGTLRKGEYARSTFLNYQAKLRGFGIDITQPPSAHSVSADIPLSDLFTPERAVVVPAWAAGTNLFFDPIALQYTRPPIVRVPDLTTTVAAHRPDAIVIQPTDAPQPPPQQEAIHQEDSTMSTIQAPGYAMKRNPLAWFVDLPDAPHLNRAEARRRGARRGSSVRSAGASMEPLGPLSMGPGAARTSRGYSKAVAALSGTVPLLHVPPAVAA